LFFTAGGFRDNKQSNMVNHDIPPRFSYYQSRTTKLSMSVFLYLGLSFPGFREIMRYMNTHVILLSGGSGKRLWPLSNDIRSKQFLSLLADGNGGLESMLQRVYRQLRIEFPHERVVLATGGAQKEQIEAQLGVSVDIVCEPARRDTFPAIALSCTFLADSCNAAPDDVVLVLPVDVYADQEYFSTVRKIRDAVARDAAELVLMGIAPNIPSDRFGYMVPSSNRREGYPLIDRFVEKPVIEVAQNLITQGALWNGGVFGFRLGYLLDIVDRQIGKFSYGDLLDSYASVEKISFDYAVVEKAESIAMVRYSGMWRDLGTWETLSHEIGNGGIGRHAKSQTENTIVVNELDIPIVAIGTKDLVIAASADGILVSDRRNSNGLKPLVDTFDDPPRFVQYAWGSSRVVDRIVGHGKIRQETHVLEIRADQEYRLSCTDGEEKTFLCIEGECQLFYEGASNPLKRGERVLSSKERSYRITCTTAVRALETVWYTV
jgi:mannose-1-phosphate guanylyltransferase